MATLPATINWDVTNVTGSVGADTNGGGFDSAAVGIGTDYSTATTPHVAYTDLLAGVTVPSAPTVSNSTTGGAVAANSYIVQITYTVVIAGVTYESAASANSATQTTSGSTSTITVTSPAASSPSLATGYNVYIQTGGTGSFFLANTSAPIAIGTNYPQTALVPTSGNTPGVGTTSMGYILTSVLTPPVTAHIGNILNVTGGTGFTTGRWCVLGIGSGTTPCAAMGGPSAIAASPPTTGVGTGNLGGAFQTVTQAASSAVISNWIHIRGPATYALSSASFNPPAGAVGSPFVVKGYHTTHGDLDDDVSGVRSGANYPTIQTSAGTSATITGGNYLYLYNLIVDPNGHTGTTWSTGQEPHSNNCWFKTTGTSGGNTILVNSGLGFFWRCVIEGAPAGVDTMKGAIVMSHCRVTVGGGRYCVQSTGGFTAHKCVFVGGTTATSDCINVNAAGNLIFIAECAFEKPGRDAINFAISQSDYRAIIYNNVISNPAFITGATGYGIQLFQNWTAFTPLNYNAFYLTGSVGMAANYSNVPGLTSNLRTGDVQLTGIPWNNASTGDYSLNNTAGAGAACRSVGTPGTIPPGGNAATMTGYQDMGAIRHQDPAGGAGLLMHAGMDGGISG